MTMVREYCFASARSMGPKALNLGLAAVISVACSSGDDDPGVRDAGTLGDARDAGADDASSRDGGITGPSILRFAAAPDLVKIGEPVSYSWQIGGLEGAAVRCQLDPYGDGAFSVAIEDCAGTTTLEFEFLRAGAFTSALRLDLLGATTAALEEPVIVENTLPTIEEFVVSPNPGRGGDPSAFTWRVTDPDPQQTLSCVFDPGDPGVAPTAIADCRAQVGVEHVYDAEGAYSATLTVMDDDGGTSTATIEAIRIVPEVRLAATLSQSVVRPGERALTSITISNPQAVPLAGVRLNHIVPAGISFGRASNTEPNVSSGCGSICTEGATAQWLLGELAAGESRTVTIDALVAASALPGSSISLLFEVEADGVEPIRIMKSVDVATTVRAELALSASVDPVAPGDQFVLVADLGNVSATALVDARVDLELPAGVTVREVSAGGAISGNAVSWAVGDIGTSSSLSRWVRCEVAPSLTSGDILVARAELSYEDGRLVDHASEHTVTVVSTPPALVVDVGASVDPAESDGREIYTITVGNRSALPVTDVVVQVRVPDELNFDRTLQVEPNQVGNGCSTLCYPRQEALWVFDSLASGETQTITIDALVDASYVDGTLIALPVRVEAEQVPDTIDRLHVVRIDSPSAELVLSASSDPVTASETFDFIVDVGNISASTLSTTTLRLSLPPDVAFVSASHGGMVAGDEVTWDLGSFVATDSVRRTVRVTAGGGVPAGSMLRARAELRYAGGLEVDHESEHTVTVVSAPPALVVDVGASVDPAESNGRELYTITVGNRSALPLTDVVVQVRVPDELNFDRTGQVEPNQVGNGCSTLCYPRQEALWVFDSL
ncbi:MAG: PKD domain-containing protein, partial [Deltaproteobacteria bacterium]